MESKKSASASVYAKFLNLVQALGDAPAFPLLDATEERLLNQLAAAWSTDQRVTVLEAMNMAASTSPTTIHRRLKSLQKKGVIKLDMDQLDNRIKYVLPTPLTTGYFAKLSKCLVAAARHS